MIVRYKATAFLLLLLLAGCNKSKPEAAHTATLTETPKTEADKNTFCFREVSGQDTTTVSLTLEGNQVSGQMRWNPYQKDGANGKLTGTRKAKGELDLLYDYTIEGNRQTETKIMKIETGTLLIKTGELTDPKNDGNLVYKDVAKAVFSEVLKPVPCPLP